MQEIQYIYMCTHVYICVCMNIHRILTNTMPFFFLLRKVQQLLKEKIFWLPVTMKSKPNHLD